MASQEGRFGGGGWKRGRGKGWGLEEGEGVGWMGRVVRVTSCPPHLSRLLGNLL